jgi:hypothetical protein
MYCLGNFPKDTEQAVSLVFFSFFGIEMHDGQMEQSES